MAEPLKGLRVLVVEDDYLIATWIEHILNAAGCVVAEPITHLAQAQQAARENPYDAAVLDINLRGEYVYPVAEILSEREIPYLFVSGYDTIDLPAGYEGRPKLGKPFRSEQLLQALSSLVSAPSATAALVSQWTEGAREVRAWGRSGWAALSSSEP